MSISALQDRARLYAAIRAFFEARGVLEVQTPCLGAHTVSDPHIASMRVSHEGKTYYLQTSPEFAMKRLLGRGSGPIYQLSSVFRAGESGSRHNPEFAMLEWYRPGFSLEDLMNEMAALLEYVSEFFESPLVPEAEREYGDLFVELLGIDPHRSSETELRKIADAQFPGELRHLDIDDEGSLDDLRDFLFSTAIEPHLREPVFVTDFPASQAALARTARKNGVTVARRFELFAKGLELANGYDELLDSGELKSRIERDNRIRASRDLPQVQPDSRLLEAMEQMPACAGVALGLDRLLMLVGGYDDIADVMPFTILDA